MKANKLSKARTPLKNISLLLATLFPLLIAVELLWLPLRDKSTEATEPIIGCLRKDCINAVAAGLARTFKPRPPSVWCSQQTSTPDNTHGILLTKVPKVASSTSAGVALRIGRRNGCRAIQWRHGNTTETWKRYDKSRSFWFTTIRNPSSRALSSLFFHVVSRKSSVNTTDEWVIRQLKAKKQDHHYGTSSKGQGGFQLRYIAPEILEPFSAWQPTNATYVRKPKHILAAVKRVIELYDFIIVTERMDDSLVAMALLMGIDVADTLVASSKVSGSKGFHLLQGRDQTVSCVPTVAVSVGADVRTFLSSPEWRARNYGDLVLHEAAVISLDRTISSLGQDRFQRARKRYHGLKQQIVERCSNDVHVPCSDKGQPQLHLSAKSCYLKHHDFGCGFPCIDHIVDTE